MLHQGHNLTLGESEEVAFVSFLTQFLENKSLCVYATKILSIVSVYFPEAVCKFFDFYNEPAQLFGILSTRTETIQPYSRVSRGVINFYFSFQNPEPHYPHFIFLVAKNLFASTLFLKYRTLADRWKVLTAVIEITYDLCLVHRNFSESLVETHDFVEAMFFLIKSGFDAFHDFKPISTESINRRFDSDELHPCTLR